MTYRTALALAAALAACKPDPASLHRNNADDLMRESKFPAAAEAYARSLEVDPRQEKVWEKLAYARVKAGDRDLAAEALVKLATLRATDAQKAEVYRNAAGIYLQGTDRDKAEKYLVEAVRLDPADEASLTWLGEIASEKGGARLDAATAVPEELEKAIGYYDKLIALRPDGKAAHANRRIAVVKYLGYLAEERHKEEQRLRGSRRDASAAAAVRDRLAHIDAKLAELRRMLDESNHKLAPVRKAAG